jgi:two-component system sensor histidine kinase/response regulator
LIAPSIRGTDGPEVPTGPLIPRILVVDDNVANRLLVVETLAPEGMEVSEAASGDEALRAFAAQPFDVVLLDVRMPGLDGFATLERLRTLPGGDAPVVFLTALRDVDTFDRARAAGAVDFLTKPVRPSELLARVDMLVRLRRLGAEADRYLGEIRRQRDDLLRVQLQKERLAAFIVHDLKNPLSSMRLYAEVVGGADGLPSEAREAAEAIRDQCDRLNRLVLNLLDVSKADEGTLTIRPTPVDVPALVTELLVEVGRQAEQRRVTLAVEIAPQLIFELDRDLVHRLLQNLLDNAVRHTPKGGTVRVEGAVEGGALVLRVRDDGVGIPEAMRERIFDPFVQLDTGPSSSRSGRGLGLAFCRAAAIAHGGSIAVEPSAVGACFTVRLLRSPS